MVPLIHTILGLGSDFRVKDGVHNHNTDPGTKAFVNDKLHVQFTEGTTSAKDRVNLNT